MPHKLIIIVLAGLLAGCGGPYRDVTGEPPMVDLGGLSLDGTEVVMEISVRNVNDGRLENRVVSLELEIEDQVLARTEPSGLHFDIAPRGRDLIPLRADADAEAKSRLRALGEGEIDRLPWSLTLNLSGSRRFREPITAEGYLYPVPGQPERFR